MISSVVGQRPNAESFRVVDNEMDLHLEKREQRKGKSFNEKDYILYFLIERRIERLNTKICNYDMRI